jgi:hypothetical protein
MKTSDTGITENTKNASSSKNTGNTENTRKTRNTENTEKIWNLLSMVVFILLLIAAGILFKERGIEITEISLLDLFLICVASYRLMRLIVYDRLFKLFRDMIRSFSGTGLGDSLVSIVTCPWCVGVWIALLNVVIFYIVPFGGLFIYVMSIAGIATFFQIGVNIVGMAAEEKQMDVKEKRNRTGFRH